MTITIAPIGVVRGGRTEIYEDHWGPVTSTIGLDAIDGSPVVDIKPYTTAFNPAGPVREPAWMGELMREYY